MGYAYYNGFFGMSEDIRIPLSDRVVFFGDGVYDVAVGKCEKIHLLDEHTERILVNARRLGMPQLPKKKELELLIHEVVKKSEEESFLVYFQLSRQLDFRAHSAEKCKKTNILITVNPIDLYKSTGNIRLILRDDMRYMYCDVKTVNLLPAVIASSEAEAHGCDECVFVRGDAVTECAHSNIAIIKNGQIITHPINRFILPGITRRHMLIAASELGIPTEERPFSKDELFSADEVFITSTTKLIKRVYEIEGQSVGMRDERTFCTLRDEMYNSFTSFFM